VRIRASTIVCLGLLVAAPTWAQQQPPAEETCTHDKGWKPTTEELQRVLSSHGIWLANGRDPSLSEERANLCNADMSGTQLDHADLSYAMLYQVDLSKANLRFATLNGANLSWAKLNGANLSRAKLNGANLSWAELGSAHLQLAELNSADLTGAQLNSADLWGAQLKKALLFETGLDDADLSLADLSRANLDQTSVAGATLAGSFLTGATYNPRSAPPDPYVAGIYGLSTVRFPSGQEIGLVQLRDLLQKAGLRDLEREATFAIESGKTRNLIESWREEPAGAAEGLFRYVAFDLTTAYGLHPGRALLLIAALWAMLIAVYAWPIWRSKRPLTSGSIARTWPKERIEVRDGQLTLDNSARVERLHKQGFAAVGWAAYFSLLSAFQIGFREFSVGTWLSRAQPRNFSLESVGWIRTVSGLQSLLSVYLLAMWLLTYFGRPFQ